MYFEVRCRLVTTPPSWVIFLVILRPPVRHAASTRYLCLKCDLYDLSLGHASVLLSKDAGSELDVSAPDMPRLVESVSFWRGNGSGRGGWTSENRW